MQIDKIINRIKNSRLKNENTEICLFEMNFHKNNYDTIKNVRVVSNISELDDFIDERKKEEPNINLAKYRKQIIKRFENHSNAYVYESDGKIVSAVFACPKSEYCNAINYKFVLPENVCGIVDGYTLKKYRGNSYYKILYSYAFSHLADTGFGKGWFWIVPHNKSSLIVHKKVGLEFGIRKITLIQRFGLRWHVKNNLQFNIDDIIQEPLNKK
jgi:hypothetical protein